MHGQRNDGERVGLGLRCFVPHERCRDFFSEQEEKDLEVHIELGDDGRYNATKIGTITFQMESISPLKLQDVMFIPSPKKNLISVAVLEDYGYDVI